MRTPLKALLVASLVTAGACGGGSEGKDLPRFLGIWTPIAGTQTTTCGGSVTPEPISQNVTWTAGSTSDLIQPLMSISSCIVHADVDGDTATGTDFQPARSRPTTTTATS